MLRQSGVRLHVWNPSTCDTKGENWSEFEVSLGYILSLLQKKEEEESEEKNKKKTC